MPATVLDFDRLSDNQQQVLDSLNRITIPTKFGKWRAQPSNSTWVMLELHTANEPDTRQVRQTLVKAGIWDFNDSGNVDYVVRVRTRDVAEITPVQETIALQALQKYRRDIVVCDHLDQIIDYLKMSVPITPEKFFAITDGAYLRLGVEDGRFRESVADRLTEMGIKARPNMLGNHPAIEIPASVFNALSDAVLEAVLKESKARPVTFGLDRRPQAGSPPLRLAST